MTKPLRLNLGAGRNHCDPAEGWVNVDIKPPADQIWDLESFPWPWPDNSTEIVLLNHVMEHLGREPVVFLKIMQELYRICLPNAQVFINVPHPRHDYFLGDPTHVRPIIADTFVLFSKEANRQFREQNGANSLFAEQLNVDFQLVANQYVLDKKHAYLKDDPAWSRIVEVQNNIIEEIKIELRVIKNG